MFPDRQREIEAARNAAVAARLCAFELLASCTLSETEIVRFFATPLYRPVVKSKVVVRPTQTLSKIMELRARK
jgi:hypothetical protein